MTKREAHRYVCRVLAVTLENDFDNGSVWLEQHPNGSDMSEADKARVRDAAEIMKAELERRSARRGST